MNTELNKLLNARLDDLNFELGVFLNLHEVSSRFSSNIDDACEEIEEHLMKKLNIDLESIALEEEIEQVDVETKHIKDALVYAVRELQGKLKTYVTKDRYLQELRNTGVFEEELEGMSNFFNRLERELFSTLEITEKDLSDLENQDEK